MQTLKIVFIIFIALLIEILLTKRLAFLRYLDLTLLVTVYFGLQRQPVLGMLTGAAAGLSGDAVDLVAGGVLGVGGFSKTLLGYVLSVLSIKFPLENPLLRLAVVAVSSVANTVIYAGLILMLGRELHWTANWIEFGQTIGWKALADTTASVFIFVALDKVFPEQPSASKMQIRKRFYE